MIKHAFISTLLLVGLVTSSSYGQNSAQTTMRVSVTVVNGASVEAKTSPIVWFSEEENAEIGQINLEGIEKGEVLINNSDQIILTDKNGHQVEMDVKSTSQDGSDENSIQFMGTKSKDMMSSVYRGEINTSIEYF